MRLSQRGDIDKQETSNNYQLSENVDLTSAERICHGLFHLPDKSGRK